MTQEEKKIEFYRNVVILAAKMRCDIALYNTLPDCPETYPDDTLRWCLGCLARAALKKE